MGLVLAMVAAARRSGSYVVGLEGQGVGRGLRGSKRPV